MKQKDLKLNFRYLGGNIACLSVDSIDGKLFHNDINNDEAIIIFNSLVGEKENCQTIKTLLEENAELKKQTEEYKDGYFSLSKENIEYVNKLHKYKSQQKEFVKYLEDEINDITTKYSQINGSYFLLNDNIKIFEKILTKYKEIIGGENE